MIEFLHGPQRRSQISLKSIDLPKWQAFPCETTQLR